MLSLIYLYTLLVILGYLFGNVHGAYIIGKIFRNQDIREYGSGNSGSTNALRVYGFKLALPAFLIDFSKAFFPLLYIKGISEFLLGIIGVHIAFSMETVCILRMIMAISILIGHNYPFVLNFKGGKGIACSVGILMMIHPLCGLIYGLIILAIAFTTGYVSLGSVISSLLSPVIIYLLTRNMTYFLLGLVVAVFAVYRHKTNIARLKNGTENKFGRKK